MSHSFHLQKTLNPKELKETAYKVCELIKKYYPETNYIAVSGNSGTIMAGMVSVISEIPIILVRKNGEDCNSTFIVEFETPKIENPKYIIIDDLISSGHTINYITKQIDNPQKSKYSHDKDDDIKFEFLGVILYHDWWGKEFYEIQEESPFKRGGLSFKVACVEKGIN